VSRRPPEPRSAAWQRYAHEAHQRAQAALERSDLADAIAEDDEAADAATAALMERIRERTRQWERQGEAAGE
jgi:hypothetical protein